MAKVTYIRGRKPNVLNKINKLAKVTSPSGIGDLSQFVYLVEPLWFSPSGIDDLSQDV
jgi:hypothetical protein